MSAKIAACQTPDIRGDIEAALQWIEDCAAEAEAQDVDLLCFPEGFLQGYETKDGERARRLALGLQSAAFAAILDRLAPIRPMLVFGLTELDGDALYNCAAVVERGRLLGKYRKTRLLAGEAQCVFEPGTQFPVFTVAGLTFGINICYDTGAPEAAAAVAAQGADLIVCLANNMMSRAKAERAKPVHNRERAKRCVETGLWMVSADVTGERDGRVAYGPTAFINPQGQVVAQVPLEQTGMVVEEIAIASAERS